MTRLLQILFAVAAADTDPSAVVATAPAVAASRAVAAATNTETECPVISYHIPKAHIHGFHINVDIKSFW